MKTNHITLGLGQCCAVVFSLYRRWMKEYDSLLSSVSTGAKREGDNDDDDDDGLIRI